jgi:hypothetical protein
LTGIKIHVSLKEILVLFKYRGTMGESSANGATWRTVKRCDNGQCVEIGALGALILIRSSADADGSRIGFNRGAWQMFVDAVKDGSYDSL